MDLSFGKDLDGAVEINNKKYSLNYRLPFPNLK